LDIETFAPRFIATAGRAPRQIIADGQMQRLRDVCH
jgi:hypothetical protein